MRAVLAFMVLSSFAAGSAGYQLVTQRYERIIENIAVHTDNIFSSFFFFPSS